MSSAIAFHGKTCKYESVDRISNLPAEVINQILHRLPIKDAVKTSALSQGWRFKWTHMSEMLFHNYGVTYSNFANFISRFLLLHQGEISKFELIIVGDEYACSDVDQWMLFLSRKNVAHLKLSFEEPPIYQMPSSLLSYQSLKTLTLECCSLQLPSEFQGFASLTYINLRVVSISDQTFERLLCKTPLLQTLKIYGCEPLDHFNIYAPNLKSVNLRSQACEWVDFRNAPNVTDAILCLWFPVTGLSCKLDDVFGGLYAVQTIKIKFSHVKFLPMNGTPNRLEMTYYNLTNVYIKALFEDSTHLQAILCLCRSSPNLKSLKIKAKCNSELGENFWEGRMHREVGIFDHLETVRLKRFVGGINDNGLAQFILLNATVLDTFCIIWSKYLPVDLKPPAVERMMQYQRTSSNAKVVFKDNT